MNRGGVDGVSRHIVGQTRDNVRNEKQPLGGASTPLIQGADDHELRISDRVSIVAPSPLPTTRHPASRLDGCPECVHNVEPPKSWVGDVKDITCAYVCSDCGHAWLTSWKD